MRGQVRDGVAVERERVMGVGVSMSVARRRARWLRDALPRRSLVPVRPPAPVKGGAAAPTGPQPIVGVCRASA